MTVHTEVQSELSAEVPNTPAGRALVQSLVRPAILELDTLKDGETRVIQVGKRYIVGLGGISRDDDERGPAVLASLSAGGQIPSVLDVARIVFIESPSGNTVALIEAH